MLLKISAFIKSPVFSESHVANIGVNEIRFDEDISVKKIPLNLFPTAEERCMDNDFTVFLSPITFFYSFKTDWQYYFDVDVKLLKVNIYQNTWLFDLFTYPAVQWDSSVVKQAMPFSLRVDEPPQATRPSDEYGKVAITLHDKSGISEVIMYYSTDRSNWENTLMEKTGEIYSVAPIEEVSEEITVYYYMHVKDGDEDFYKIDNMGNYYSYTLKPQPKLQPKQTPIAQLLSPSNLLFIRVIIFTVFIIVGVIL